MDLKFNRLCESELGVLSRVEQFVNDAMRKILTDAISGYILSLPQRESQ
jgi:hypothetical protein